MSDFIIERELENVKNPKTREYLTEVVSSYQNGNYRAATVVLYSILVFDLIEKLRILSEIYQDKSAEKILNEIKEFQNSHPKNSKWEQILFERISKETNLLNAVEIEKIEHLNFDRNISAHPLYDNDYKLINLNREQVRANIRNAFEYVFTKDALLSKDILKTILENSVEYYSMVGQEGFKKHLKTKYYSRLTDGLKIKIFHDLWKIAFMSDHQDSVKNRSLTTNLLITLLEDNYQLLLTDYRKNIEYYSNIKPSDYEVGKDFWLAGFGDTRITALIELLSYYPTMYNNLTESAKEIIKAEAKKNIVYFFHAYFLSDSLEEHINNVKQMHTNIYASENWVDTSKYNCIMNWNFKELYKKTLEIDDGDTILNYSIDYYRNCPSYDDATYVFDNHIQTMMEYYKNYHIVSILNVMNENNQIYDSREFPRIKKTFFDYSKAKLGDDFDVSQYQNI